VGRAGASWPDDGAGKAIKALKPGPQPDRKVFNERLERYRKAADEKANHPEGAARK
jgi:hypothetical protein